MREHKDVVMLNFSRNMIVMSGVRLRDGIVSGTAQKLLPWVECRHVYGRLSRVFSARFGNADVRLHGLLRRQLFRLL